MSDRPTLGTLIITHNEADNIVSCLQSFTAQTRLPDTLRIVNDSSTDATAALDEVSALRLGYRMQGQRGLTGRLRPVDLDHATPGHPPDPQCQVQRQGAGRNAFDLLLGVLFTQAHDRTVAITFGNIFQSVIKCFVFSIGHRYLPFSTRELYFNRYNNQLPEGQFDSEW